MQIFNSIGRHFAFKLKEIELRFRTWKRAREISRAYSTDKYIPFRIKTEKVPKIKQKPISAKQKTAKPPKVRTPKIRTQKIKTPKTPKVRKPIIAPAFHAIRPYLAKTAKLAAAAVVVAAAGIGIAAAVPYLSEMFAANAVANERLAAADVAFESQSSFEVGDFPETGILPEGFQEMSTHEEGTDPNEDFVEQPTISGTELAEYFRRNMPQGFTEFLILVNKAAKVMYVMRDTPTGWVIERAYDVATGEVEGPKRVEGDKKTPQGEYFIVGRKHRSELTHVYGPAAFILDYPNPEDRAAGFTGHGIWIHGSELGNVRPHFTAGCVASSNPDIVDFAKLVRDWIGVPVLIVSGEESPRRHFNSIDFSRVANRRQEVMTAHAEQEAEFIDLIMRWKTAWETKNIEAYTEFYSTTTFANGAQRWEAYRDHKLRTFAMYERINITISDITLTELTRNSATVKFNQVYETNLNRLENAKRLIFRRENGEWKIFREIPFPKEELLT